MNQNLLCPDNSNSFFVLYVPLDGFLYCKHLWKLWSDIMSGKNKNEMWIKYVSLAIFWVFFCQMNLFLTCSRKYPRRSAPTDLENKAWTLPPHVLKRNGESTANEWLVDQPNEKTQPELATPKRDELANLIRISRNLSGHAREQESKQAQIDSEGKNTE